MAVDTIRKSALKAFSAVVRGGAYTAQASKREFSQMDAQQKRFALKLLNESIERIYTIDYILSQFTDVSRTEPVVEDIMRMGVCQLYYMDSVPDHAAIDCCVELCRDAGHERYTKLVNGVLRSCARSKGTIKPPERYKDLAAHLSVRYSWPLWMARLFLAQRGPEEAEGIMGHQAQSHITIRANPLKGITTESLLGMLNERNVPYEQGRIVPDAIRLKTADNVAASTLFTSGGITIQGEGSQLIASIAAKAAGKGASVLDCCAAPGGKSAAIAAALNNETTLRAWDVHDHRVKLMQQTYQRLGVQAETELHDARFPDGNLYDVVLVDAPCSGLGVAWNSPDIKLQRKEREMFALSELQKRILNGAAKMVKPEGYLIYSTCTINKDENEHNARWFLREHKEFYAPQLKKFLPEGVECSENMLQLLPHVHGTEGFFVAIFGKKR